MWFSLSLLQRSIHVLEGELAKKILLEGGVPKELWFLYMCFFLAVKLILIKINNTNLIDGIPYAKKETRSETIANDTSKSTLNT